MFCARISNLLRRITTLLIICCLLTVGLCVNTAAALPGSGTQEDPWRIESLADFDEFAAEPNYWDDFTRLQIDVNLAGRTYSTAVIAADVHNSNGDFDGTAFTGVFDGNDHKIMNLTIDDGGAGNEFVGLFGCIEDGEVTNLGLEGGSVSGGDLCVGGLVGENWGSISNCYSTGNVNGTSYWVGGLVGVNHGGQISNCYSNGSVSGASDVGGLVGVNGGTVSNCYSTGSVSGGGWCVGGLLGDNGGSVSTCYSTGDVNGYESVGGLVGGNYGSVSDCYSTSDVNGVDSIGGLLGLNHGSISTCYSAGSVTGGDSLGGLVGTNWGSVSSCYSTGDVNGVDYVGGLVGANHEASISNCYSTGDANGVYGAGGLVGLNGYCDGLRCYPGYIFNSYSTGDVNGVDGVGGLVGATGCGDIETSFWDVETSGEPNMCGSQSEWTTGCDPNCGKTTAEMQTKSTFTEAGWDFVEIWLINQGATYPVLRQEIRSDLNGNAGVDFADFAIFADHWLEGKGD